MEKITPMAKTLLAVLTLCLLFVPLAAAGEPPNLRVLSYNIHHGEGVDHKLDLKRIARVIKSVSPDVVALQEVDRGTERTDRVDQPAELARLTNMKVLFERNIDYQGGQYGNAILSKLPITRHENVHLPLLDDGEQRGLLIAELKWQSQEILFLCTHLDFRADDHERLASAKRINNLIEKRASKPAILAGDLNASRDSAVLKIFTEKWAITNERELPTVPVSKPKRQIDFVLTLRSTSWKVIEVRVLDEAIASDHRAILAILQLQAVKPKPDRRNKKDTCP